MIRAILAAGLALVLCACATTTPQTVVKTVTVYLPTPVSCIPKDSPDPPVYKDTREKLLAAPDWPTGQALVDGEWGIRDARLSYLETLRAICMKVAP